MADDETLPLLIQQPGTLKEWRSDAVFVDQEGGSANSVQQNVYWTMMPRTSGSQMSSCLLGKGNVLKLFLLSMFFSEQDQRFHFRVQESTAEFFYCSFFSLYLSLHVSINRCGGKEGHCIDGKTLDIPL